MSNNVQTYPLELGKITKTNGWLLCNKQSDYGKLLCKTFDLEILDAETLSLKDYKYIIYNPLHSIQRIRFSVAHEIGHIVLLHRPLRVPEIEKEADMFAARILMPMALIREYNIQTPEELARTCNVSLKAANYRMTRYKMLERRNKFYLSPLEQELREKIKINKG